MTSEPRLGWRHWIRWLRWVLVTAGALVIWSVVMGSNNVRADWNPHSDGSHADENDPARQEELVARGQEVFRGHCSTCHNKDGSGVEGKGPNIRSEGEAAANFVLRTGRMPLADPGHQAERGPVRLSEADIKALVAFVGAMDDGPAIPEVDTRRADMVRGGKLFRLNCAVCHIASGSGAIIGGGYRAPDLMLATPTQVGEAVIVGPGAMPVFSDLSTEEVNDIAAYVVELQRQRTTDVESLGGIGPVAEGLVAWLLGILVLVGFTRWMGTSHRARRHWKEPS